MATLHIEHPITDLKTWLGAFGRFEEARLRAGVKAERIHQPVDDDMSRSPSPRISISLSFSPPVVRSSRRAAT